MNRVTPIVVAALLTVAGALAAAPRAEAAPLLCTPGQTCLTIEPATTNVFVGDTFSVDVMIWDVTDLFAYDVELSVAPAFLKVTSITDGLFLSGPGGTGNFASNADPATGETFGADSRQGFATPGVSDGGAGAVLFTVALKALAPGTTLVAFDLCDRGDPFCTQLQDASTAFIDYTAIDGEVNVLPRVAPEPGLLALLALGASLRLRRQERRTKN